MNIIWSAQARGDLRAIRNFIARDSEHYARLQIERLLVRVEQTAGMPSKGHPVHEFIESDLRKSTKAATESSTAFRMSSFKW